MSKICRHGSRLIDGMEKLNRVIFNSKFKAGIPIIGTGARKLLNAEKRKSGR